MLIQCYNDCIILYFPPMGEQFSFPFDNETPTPQPNQEQPVSANQEALPLLEELDRQALEKLYFEKVGNHRFMGRTDDEVREAIRNPEAEIDRLREIDKVDPWADLGPTGK